MQSEDLEKNTSFLEVSSSKIEMTCSDNVADSSSPTNQAQDLDNTKNYQQENPTSEANFKMIPDSPKLPENTDMEEVKFDNTRHLNLVNKDQQMETEKVSRVLDQREPANNESIRNWLQRITQMQTEIQRKLTSEQSSSPNLAFSEFPMKTSSSNVSTSNSVQNSTSSRVVKYQDLPYMGEMTLDNSKPRRGRKPKKADICHLIYKNYGTIYPGTPNPKSLVDREASAKKTTDNAKFRESPLSDAFNRSDVQNRIISSLLEKRLTQESKRQKEITASSTSIANRIQCEAADQNEPLNLCIKDLNQLKIRLLRKHDNVYSSENAADVKSEPQSDDDVEFVHETPSPSSTTSSRELKFPTLVPELSPRIEGEAVKLAENGAAPGGYVYWPNAGIFIHPMALQQHLMYYQKLAANNNYTLPNNLQGIQPETNQNANSETSELRKLAPKIKVKKSENLEEGDASTEPKPKRNASGSSDKTPTKRKRSAIFIPPIPAENQTNPATEVSICKFKFTGGAKPSLQEKKMLSVDSGGNFRYYNGTGDKSMRGYEFFPRETLQQQINAQGSSTGAFLQASGEKIFPLNTSDFPGKAQHDFLLTPELQTQSLPSTPDLGSRHKKRKSRKSLQREKLEQTFKEKGFLIQTQQLESAEGATYCKFRQLRKFTRYLFRSWKDYLPGIANEEERKQEIEENDNDADLENASTLSDSELKVRYVSDDEKLRVFRIVPKDVK